MKLIYAQGACSLSVHILLEELGISYEKEEVSLSDKTVLLKYNPKGYVPALVLDNGDILTEAINILQYVCEVNKNTNLYPKSATIERARCNEWLSFFSSEIHKGIGLLFNRDMLTSKIIDDIVKRVESRLKFTNEHLINNQYLLGDNLSIADMYGVAILRLVEHVKVNLDKFPEVKRYKCEMEIVPSVERAIMDEEHNTNYFDNSKIKNEEAQISS